MSATLVLVVIAVAVIAIALLLAHWWDVHRKHPQAIRQKARDLWGRTGLHWSAPEYLTAQLLISLAITIAGIAVFALLADWVSDKAAITDLDLRFDNTLHAHATPIGITIAKAVSFIGGPVAMAVLMVAGAIYLLVRREMLLLYGWLVAFLGGSALDWADRKSVV